MSDDPFFVGWADTAPLDRRFMLRAALGLTLAGAGMASLLAMQQAPPGAGQWTQSDVRDWTGLLMRKPYPSLRTRDLDGTPRTAFLATSGKLGVHARLPPTLRDGVRIRASAITRGPNMMLAVVDDEGWIAPITQDVSALTPAPPDDLGCAVLVGEILDAKCWFGAMKPGFGKTHKSCAALCARGRLPLAFCSPGGALCTTVDTTLLFVDANGRAHGPAVLPYLADPVSVTGQIVRVGDITQYRVALDDIRRI